MKEKSKAFSLHCQTNPLPDHDPNCGKGRIPVCQSDCPQATFTNSFYSKYDHVDCKEGVFCREGWKCPVALKAFAKEEEVGGKRYTGATIKARAQKLENRKKDLRRKEDYAAFKRVKYAKLYPGFEVATVRMTAAERILNDDRILGKYRVKKQSRLRKSITRINRYPSLGRI
jgi:hypothetical protein